MKKNDILTLNITDLNNLGYGVGRVDGKTVFVSGAVDGDVVKAKIIRDNSSYSIAITEDILTPSPYRIESQCKVCRQCGGCAYAAISYDHELEIKKRTVLSSFIKCGVQGVDVKDVYSDGAITHYRNKAIIPIGYDPRIGFISGFYAPKTHRIIPADDCLLHRPIFNVISNSAKEIMSSDTNLYLTNDLKPIIKSLYFRASANDDIELTLVLEKAGTNAEQKLCDKLIAVYPQIKTVFSNLNPGDISTVLSDKFNLLFGPGYIYDEMCGVRLKITPASFYQVNHDMAEALYKKGAELLDPAPSDLVCDLYCGIGSIGLSVFGRNRLIGIEVVESAVRCAKENSALNGIDASYYCGDAAKVIESLNLAPDSVVLDPPRKGCSKELIDFLCIEKKIPKILYISCNPATLARDVKIMLDSGYSMSSVYPFDLFPRTGHVESVVCLSREKADDYIRISVHTEDLKAKAN